MLTGDLQVDKAAIEVGTAIFKEVLKSAWSGASKMPDWIRKKYADADPFGLEATKYCERIEKQYNSMRIIGMPRAVPIRSIFVRVNILQKISSQRRSTLEAMELELDRDRASFGLVASTMDGLKVADNEPRLIVLGKPGGGKTTFLKWLALSAMDGHFTKRKVPVFVPLKDWSDGKDTIQEFINNEFKISGFEEPQGFVTKLLETGNLILLLDALDEVNDPGRLTVALKEVRALSSKYPAIKIILSCRTAAYNYIFEQFVDVELADFQHHQVERFVRNWFVNLPGKGELCLSELALDKNRPIRNLCATPLLLTLMCLAFDEGMSFPSNRAELYKEALDALLKKWDSSRAVRRNTAYQHLSLAKKELMLSRIAAKSFENGAYFMKQDEVEREISVFMSNLKSSPSQSDAEVDPAEVLKEIEAQHGILVERAFRIYSFSHLTFQEFFTARAITENTNPNGPADLVAAHVLDPRWREVFILTTGLLAQADDFVLRIRAGLTQLCESFDLKSILRNNASLVYAVAAIPKPLRRALALSYVIERLQARDSEYGAVVGACQELVEDMQREFGRVKKLDQATIQTLKIGLDKSRKNVDEAVEYIVSRPPNVTKQLFEYIRLTRLLVNCLNVDAYITAITRQQIVESILVEDSPWGVGSNYQ